MLAVDGRVTASATKTEKAWGHRCFPFRNFVSSPVQKSSILHYLMITSACIMSILALIYRARFKDGFESDLTWDIIPAYTVRSVTENIVTRIEELSHPTVHWKATSVSCAPVCHFSQRFVKVCPAHSISQARSSPGDLGRQGTRTQITTQLPRGQVLNGHQKSSAPKVIMQSSARLTSWAKPLP